MPASLNKHQLKTEATRQKLLTAALRVFTRDGFERSRLEDIATEAGHTRGAFYANFASKEDLFIALLEHQASKRIAAVSASVKDATDPEAFRQTLRRYYVNRAKDRQWNMLTLEFKLYALRHSKKRAQFAAAHQRIRESLLSNLESNKRLIVKHDPYAKVLLEAILNGLQLEHAYDPKRISAKELTELLGRMFDMITLPH